MRTKTDKNGRKRILNVLLCYHREFIKGHDNMNIKFVENISCLECSQIRRQRNKINILNFITKRQHLHLSRCCRSLNDDLRRLKNEKR